MIRLARIEPRCSPQSGQMEQKEKIPFHFTALHTCSTETKVLPRNPF